MLLPAPSHLIHFFSFDFQLLTQNLDRSLMLIYLFIESHKTCWPANLLVLKSSKCHKRDERMQIVLQSVALSVKYLEIALCREREILPFLSL